MSDQPDMFVSMNGGVRVATDAAIARVEENADPTFIDEALQAVRIVCKNQTEFNTDDVMTLVDDASTHDNRALGAVMRKAAALGYCKAKVCACCGSDVMTKTNDRDSHGRPKKVWQSLTYGGH